MGMTMTQKILAAHAGLDSVCAGQLINAKLDIVLGNDITTPVAVNEFTKSGFNGVFDKNRIAIVLDHFVPNKDIKAAEQSKQCREFAGCHGISHFYDVGKMGIALSARTSTPAPTALWERSRPASARPIWLPAWLPEWHGSRFHQQSSLILQEAFPQIAAERTLYLPSSA